MVTSNHIGGFSSAARQFASGTEAESAKKGNVEASLSDSGVLEVRTNGSIIKIDTNSHLVSLNGEAPRPLSAVPETEHGMFNALARGTRNFGADLSDDSLQIHETFGATRIEFGGINVVLARLGPSIGIAVDDGKHIHADELALPTPSAARTLERELVS